MLIDLEFDTFLQMFRYFEHRSSNTLSLHFPTENIKRICFSVEKRVCENKLKDKFHQI